MAKSLSEMQNWQVKPLNLVYPVVGAKKKNFYLITSRSRTQFEFLLANNGESSILIFLFV